MKMNINIYADHGSYSSIKEAAFAEKTIDWLDKSNPLCDTCTESFAAYKLYDYLTKAGIENVSLANGSEDIGTTDFSIVVVGKTTKDLLPKSLGIYLNEEIQTLTSNEGYVMKELPNTKGLLLYGNSRIAVMYAMYHYLKLQGFAFISPDPQGFIIPNIGTLIPLKGAVVEQPDYKTRGFLSAYSDDSNKQFLEWTVANRLDYMSLHVNNHHFVKKLGIKLTGGGHEGMYEYLPPDQPDPNYIPAAGESPKTYFETHPEWFALRNGKREMDASRGNQKRGYYTGNNFCMSNEDAVNEFCKNYLNSIISGSLQYSDFINIWPLDNGKWCECEECAKMGNYTRQILMVAYKLSKAIKEATKEGLLKRDILLIVPAYHETLPGPDQPLPDDFDYDMITVNLFTIERCYVHDLFDEKCTEANIELADRIKEWTVKEDRHYRGDLVIGEYFNVSSFASIPVVLADRIAQDMPDYYKWGARHFNFMHMISDSWGVKIINNNLYAALMWDTKLDSYAFVDEMLNAFYEEKAKDVKQILKQVEKALENCKYIFHYQFVDGKINAFKRNVTKEQPFVSKHVQYDTILDDPNAGIDFLSGYELLKNSYADACGLYETITDDVLKERVKQLKTHLEYGVDMYTIYHMILQYAQASAKEDKASCVRIAKELKALNDGCTSYKWALAGYKFTLMYFDSLAAASWQKQFYEKIIENEDLAGAKAELTL